MPRTYRATKSNAYLLVTQAAALASSSIHPRSSLPCGAPSRSTLTALVRSKLGVHPTHTLLTQSPALQSATAISTAKLKQHCLQWRDSQSQRSRSGLVVNPYTITGSSPQAKSLTSKIFPTFNAESPQQSRSLRLIPSQTRRSLTHPVSCACPVVSTPAPENVQLSPRPPPRPSPQTRSVPLLQQFFNVAPGQLNRLITGLLIYLKIDSEALLSKFCAITFHFAPKQAKAPTPNPSQSWQVLSITLVNLTHKTSF